MRTWKVGLVAAVVVLALVAVSVVQWRAYEEAQNDQILDFDPFHDLPHVELPAERSGLDEVESRMLLLVDMGDLYTVDQDEVADLSDPMALTEKQLANGMVDPYINGSLSDFVGLAGSATVDAVGSEPVVGSVGESCVLVEFADLAAVPTLAMGLAGDPDNVAFLVAEDDASLGEDGLSAKDLEEGDEVRVCFEWPREGSPEGEVEACVYPL